MRAVAQADPGALADYATFRSSVMERCEPAILPGAARHWPIVSGGDAQDAAKALAHFDAGRPVELFVGKAEDSGRYYYGDESLEGFNFERRTMAFGDALRLIIAGAGAPGHDRLYMGSLPIESFLPGAERLTPVGFLPETVRPRVWIGHASSVACHYDTMDNVACVAAGRRRFILYPPDAIGDLYVGPLDRTMAGQPVSLAAGAQPGDPRFPRFERARSRALVAELGPGDGLYIPKLWWHQVEATEPLNILVNFWWDGFAAGPDQPYTTMLLAMAAIAERPAAERAAWRAWFDHYAFRPDGHPLAFLDEAQHGILGPLRAGNYGRLRAMVMRLLRGS